MAFVEGITLFCIGASYAVALALELVRPFRPGAGQRIVGTGFGAAGLLAHTLLLGRWLFLAEPPVALSSQAGSLLFLAWILAVFYLYGSLHHHKVSWGLFILPLVLGLVVLASLFAPAEPAGSRPAASSPPGDALTGKLDWGLVHGGLVLLAGVGVCVGFVASVMYLVQAHRLKSKALPHRGIRLLSLERLEDMNRRAIILAFPLLTAGLLVGIGLMRQQGESLAEWGHPKIVSTLVLWLVFAILLYVRYAAGVRGSRIAWLTILAFVLLLFALIFAHPFIPEDVS